MNQSKIFALHGADPEVLAYAMAKYSRSALSMEDSIAEINAQKAGDFLNTFYFSYGHKSIADLAHIPFAIENVSLLAAIEVVDEQRWDGQERSTRYQDFTKREYYTPPGLTVTLPIYRNAINCLFDNYEIALQKTQAYFHEQHPRPEGMTEAAYERTINARAFDVARYLLPLATLTSVGQIVSARTLEGQISRMLGSDFSEVQEVALGLKRAATEPAINVNHKAIRASFDRLEQFGSFSELGSQAKAEIDQIKSETLRDVLCSPTLVKYTEASEFAAKVAGYSAYWSMLLPLGDSEEGEYTVRFFPALLESDIEIVSTLLYENSHYSFSQILQVVAGTTRKFREDFIKEVLSFRGRHDELPRAFRTGGLIFDVYMDIGGFRDMHRHRRVTQIIQPYAARDFAQPEPYIPTAEAAFHNAYKRSREVYSVIKKIYDSQNRLPCVAPYVLPLGAKRRMLMKMDLAELAYIAELRTTPAGHISYRRVAWQMYQALKQHSPAIAACIADRVTNPDSPLDFFKR